MANDERKHLSETIDNMHIKGLTVENDLRAEMSAQKTRMELAQQTMLSNASSHSQPLSEMLQKTMATNKSLHEEASSFRIQMSENKLKSSLDYKRLETDLKAALATAEQLDADNKRVDVSLTNEATTASKLRLSLRQAERVTSEVYSRNDSLNASYLPSHAHTSSPPPGLPNPECQRKCEEYKQELNEARAKLLKESEQLKAECNAYAKLTDHFDDVNKDKYRWKSKYKHAFEDLELARDQIQSQKDELSRLLDEDPFDKKKLYFDDATKACLSSCEAFFVCR